MSRPVRVVKKPRYFDESDTNSDNNAALKSLSKPIIIGKKDAETKSSDVFNNSVPSSNNRSSSKLTNESSTDEIMLISPAGEKNAASTNARRGSADTKTSVDNDDLNRAGMERKPSSKVPPFSTSGLSSKTFFQKSAAAAASSDTSTRKTEVATTASSGHRVEHRRAARDATIRKLNDMADDDDDDDDESPAKNKPRNGKNRRPDADYRVSQNTDEEDDEEEDDDMNSRNDEDFAGSRVSRKHRAAQKHDKPHIPTRTSGRHATKSMANTNRHRSESEEDDDDDDDSTPAASHRNRNNTTRTTKRRRKNDDDSAAESDESDWRNERGSRKQQSSRTTGASSKTVSKKKTTKKHKKHRSTTTSSVKQHRRKHSDDETNEGHQRKFDDDYSVKPLKKAARLKIVTPLEERLDALLDSMPTPGFETVFNGGSVNVSTADTADAVGSSSRGSGGGAARRKNTIKGRSHSRDKRHHHNKDADNEHEGDDDDGSLGPLLFEQSPPFIKNGTMRDYQVRGLNFMVECLHHSLNPILADEMGLGKTIQTIALFAYFVEIKKCRKPFLVVAPKSTLHNWMAEINKWCPSLHALCLIGEKHERPEVVKAWFRANNPAGLKHHRFQKLGKRAKLGNVSSSEEEDEEDEEENEDDEEIAVEKEVNDDTAAEPDMPPPPTAAVPKASDIIAAALKNTDNRPYHILVTSYEMCLYEQSFLRKQPWSILCIDEAHRIKNEQSKLSEMVRLFTADHRVLLTGTPLQNNLRELWSLLNFLKPELFVSAEEFEEYFNLSGDKQDFLIKKLHAILRPFMLRRLKSEVEKGLPPKKEVRIYVPMQDLQRRMYKQLLIDKRALWHPKADKEGNKASRKVFNNIIMQLRKVCNHPYCFDNVDPSPPDVDPVDDDLQHVVSACGKLEFVDKLLARLKKDGHRVLLFSQMTRMLDVLDDYCRWRRYEYCRIDGQTDHASRQEQIEEFNAPNSSKFLFLLSTRAGGLGINLATADVVIIYDSDWNPQVDFQAIDRAHRIGQTKPVRVFRLVTDGSIEEGIIKRAEMKRRLDNVVIQQGRLAQAQAAAANKDELREILRASAASTLSEEAKAAEMDIDAVLAKSEARTAELDKKLEQMGESQLQHFSLDIDESRLDAYQFEGRDFRRDKLKQHLYAGLSDGFVQQQMMEELHQQQQLLDGVDGGSRGVRRRRAAVLAAQNTSEVTDLDYAYLVYCQNCQQRGEPAVPKPYQRDISSWHFPPARLLELREKEMNYFKRVIGYEPKPGDEDFEDDDEEFDEQAIDDAEADDDDDDDDDNNDDDEAGGNGIDANNKLNGDVDAATAVDLKNQQMREKRAKKRMTQKQAVQKKRNKFSTALHKIRTARPLTDDEIADKRLLEVTQESKGYSVLDSRLFAQFKEALLAIGWQHKDEGRKPDDIIKAIFALRVGQRYVNVLCHKRDLIRRYYADFAANIHTLPGWIAYRARLYRTSCKRSQEELATRALVWYVNTRCGGAVRSLSFLQAKALLVMDSPLPSSLAAVPPPTAAAISAVNGSNSAGAGGAAAVRIKTEMCSDAEDQLVLFYAYISGKSPNDNNMPNVILQSATQDDSFLSFNNNILRKLTIDDIRDRLKKLMRKVTEEYSRNGQPEVNVITGRITQAKMRQRLKHVYHVADKLPPNDLEMLLKCAVKNRNQVLSERILNSNAVRQLLAGTVLPQFSSSPPKATTVAAVTDEQKQNSVEIKSDVNEEKETADVKSEKVEPLPLAPSSNDLEPPKVSKAEQGEEENMVFQLQPPPPTLSSSLTAALAERSTSNSNGNMLLNGFLSAQMPAAIRALWSGQS